MRKIIPFNKLSQLRRSYRRKKIVHCHGVFDFFHYGHLLHLMSAKRFGDVLVVTVTPDRYVNKGPGRPHYSERQRTLMLAALDLVDHVAINESAQAMPAISALKPDFYVKGPDYQNKQKDVTGGIQLEEDAVRRAGGKLVFTTDDTLSSTEILNRHFTSWEPAQQKAIEAVKSAISLKDIQLAIDDLEGLKVTVIGEPIVDTYVFCQAEAISSKSPTVSARFINQEDYAGGSLAVANHLRALGCDVTLVITHGGEPYFRDLLRTSLAKGVHLVQRALRGVPTPRKTRYIAPFKSQRMFEMIDVPNEQWSQHDPRPFCQTMEKAARKSDVVIVTDFGHGLMEGEVIKTVESLRPFTALNVQTNSGNFGFNLFTKYKKFDYVSLDERECRLALHDRRTPVAPLARKAVRNHIRQAASITLGTGGSLYFDSRHHEHLCPTFFKDPIDSTGAGDAYFALTALLVQQGLPAAAIPFLGNCYAGLKTRIIGNKSSVSKVDLIRTVQSILR